MRRKLWQLSLADGLVEGGAGRNRQLEQMARPVDWAEFERLLGAVYAAPVGQSSYGPVVPSSTCCCTSGSIACTIHSRRARTESGAGLAPSV